MQHMTLAAKRKSWALTQADLASLLGCSADAISSYERRTRRPCFRIMVALEILFGGGALSLFEPTPASVAEALAARAAAFSITIEQGDDPASLRKREFLRVLGERLGKLVPAA